MCNVTTSEIVLSLVLPYAGCHFAHVISVPYGLFGMLPCISIYANDCFNKPRF